MNHEELTKKIDAYLDDNWDAMVEDIATLVRIPSFLESDKAADGAPFGPGPKPVSYTHLDVYKRQVSKVFAPGLRTGWIAAPKSVLARINLVKQGTDLCGSAFTQVVVEHYFTDTPWQKTLQKFVSTYRERRDAMLAALEEYFPAEASWTRPEGGFFVWVTPVSYTHLIGHALS